jgi:hypothetical protein
VERVLGTPTASRDTDQFGECYGAVNVAEVKGSRITQHWQARLARAENAVRETVDSYEELSAQRVVRVEDVTVNPRGEIITRIRPAGNSSGPRVELRAFGSTADLFVADFELFEVDEASVADRKDFTELIEALVAGETHVRQVRGVRGWRSSAIVWPTGSWKFPSGLRNRGSIFPQRLNPLPSYS